MAVKIRDQKLQSAQEVKTIKDKSKLQLNEMRHKDQMELKARNKQIEMDRRNAVLKQN